MSICFLAKMLQLSEIIPKMATLQVKELKGMINF